MGQDVDQDVGCARPINVSDQVGIKYIRGHTLSLTLIILYPNFREKANFGDKEFGEEIWVEFLGSWNFVSRALPVHFFKNESPTKRTPSKFSIFYFVPFVVRSV
jgi:hypothetical protein